jgi:hypothetical protein
MTEEEKTKEEKIIDIMVSLVDEIQDMREIYEKIAKDSAVKIADELMCEHAESKKTRHKNYVDYSRWMARSNTAEEISKIVKEKILSARIICTKEN